jgi:biopolymer transport protein ExbD
VAIGGLTEKDIEGAEETLFADINITPLTDIFLLLVVILIVSSSVTVEKIQEEQRAEKSSGLKVNLPSGEAQEIDPGRKSLVVSIQKDGAIIVDDRRVEEKDLERMFQAAFNRDNQTQVVLRADSGVSHGVVVNVMERAKGVGLSRLAIATAGGGG